MNLKKCIIFSLMLFVNAFVVCMEKVVEKSSLENNRKIIKSLNNFFVLTDNGSKLIRPFSLYESFFIRFSENIARKKVKNIFKEILDYRVKQNSGSCHLIVKILPLVRAIEKVFIADGKKNNQSVDVKTTQENKNNNQFPNNLLDREGNDLFLKSDEEIINQLENKKMNEKILLKKIISKDKIQYIAIIKNHLLKDKMERSKMNFIQYYVDLNIKKYLCSNFFTAISLSINKSKIVESKFAGIFMHYLNLVSFMDTVLGFLRIKINLDLKTLVGRMNDLVNDKNKYSQIIHNLVDYMVFQDTEKLPKLEFYQNADIIGNKYIASQKTSQQEHLMLLWKIKILIKAHCEKKYKKNII